MNSKKLLKGFQEPGAAYRGKPFWSWNGELEKDELVRQVGVMKEMGFGGYFMHSRAGLITEYLGDDWFDMINAVADEGEKQGMEAWLYDEDRWPSGSAGGKVTVDPQYRMQSLMLTEIAPEAYVPDGKALAVFYGRIDGYSIYEYRELGPDEKPEPKAGWKVMRFDVTPDAPNSNYNGTTYIDTMSLKATKRFIELTHEEYAKRCGDRLGKSIKGIFSDEPHRGHLLDDCREHDGVRTCKLCYTDDFFEEFEKRYGYSARAILPEIYYNKNGRTLWKVKHDVVDLANALFIERFAKPINDWCKAHNIIFTGHVLHEDALSCQTVPNGSLMRFYEFMGYPGIDILTGGNRCYWAAKQLESSTRQVGQTWRLSELYGCSGWQFDFKGHKNTGDWQALYGINLRCPHLSWYTMEGESKRDYPASILHQATYYHDYNAVETYFARFGYIMRQGKELCDVMVVNPIETMWSQIHIGWARWILTTVPKLQKMEENYRKLFDALLRRQIDFDLGDEEMMQRLAKVGKDEKGPYFKIGKATYRTVIVGVAETLRSNTYKLLKKFRKLGGRLVFAGPVPGFIDAEPTKLVKELAKDAVKVPIEGERLARAVHANVGVDTVVTDADGKPAHQVLLQARYDKQNGNIYIAVLNSRNDIGAQGLTLTVKDREGIISGRRYVQEWMLSSGERYSVPYKKAGGVLKIGFDLIPGEEHIFVITPDNEKLPEKPVCTEVVEEKEFTRKLPYTLDEANVCVLDFAEYRFGGSRWQGPLEVLKVDQKIREAAGIEHRGGEMLQPWFARLYKNEAYGPVKLRYRFEVETMPEGELFIAAERPEYFKITLNGKELVHNEEDGFWIDSCLKILKIPAGYVKKGENVVIAETEFHRTTNIETMYLVGNFGVKKGLRCSALTTLPEKLGFGNMEEYALPFYTGCVTYKLGKLKKPAEGEHVFISVPGYVGSLVKVTACEDPNAPDKKVLGWDPFEADVTDWVNEGRDIYVTLVCTRKNVFGPLHEVPAVTGAVGPGNFVTGGAGWSDEYMLMDSHIGKIKASWRR